MRAILFITTLLLSVSFVSAQTQIARRSFDEGTKLAREGDFTNALTAYKNAATATSGEGEFAAKVHHNIGVCYFRTGQLKEAVAEFNFAIRLSGGRYRAAYYARGMAESGQEEWAAAERSIIRATELNPEDGEAWFDLAFVYLAKRDFDSAAAAFRKAVEKGSTDAATGQNNLGVIMAMRHDLDAAEAAFKAALTMSAGRLEIAKNNLQFCRTLRNSGSLFAERRWVFAGRTKG